MSKKAVYSNKGLQVYITGEDFKHLLACSQIVIPVHIGKSGPLKGSLQVVLSFTVNSELLEALTLEQSAIDKARRASGIGIDPYIKSQMEKKEW